MMKRNKGQQLLYFPVGRKLMGATIAYLLGVWSCALFALHEAALAAATCACLLAAYGLRRKRYSAYALYLICAFLTGHALCGAQLNVSDAPTQPNTPISGTILRLESDWRVVLDNVVLGDGRKTNRPVVVTLMTQEDEEESSAQVTLAKVGQRVAGTGRLFGQDEIRNPGGTDDRLRALSGGYELSGYLLPGWSAQGEERISLTEGFRQIRLRLLGRLEDLFGEQSALFAAVMLGEKDGMDADMSAAMRLTGIAHILSVSGMHLSLISGGIYAVFRLLRMKGRKSRVLHAALLFAFTGLTGCAVGTVRALIMALMRLYARSRGLRYDRLTALSFAALLITLVNPAKAYDGGFQFSFFVVLGIALLETRIASFAPIRFLKKHAQPLGDLLTISLCAQLAAIPMQLSLYGYVPLLSLPMNLLCGMFMPLIMTGGWCVLGISAVSGGIAAVCAGSLGKAAQLFEAMTCFVAGMDGSILRLPAPGRGLLLLFGAGMMLASLAIRFGRRRKAAFCCVTVLFLLFYLPRLDPSARYVQLDVGQGDAAVIRSGRHAVLIDVGPEESYDALRYLRHEGLFVDAVIFSHLDEDHAGALKTLLSSEVEIDRVVMAEGAEEDVASIAVRDGLAALKAAQAEGKTKVETLRKGDSFAVGDAEFVSLHTNSDSAQGNEGSLLLRAEIGGRTILLTGDLPIACEPDALPRCDVLKVAHHGSKYATSDALIESVQPEIALISVGASNRYGHPGDRVIKALKAAGASVYRTDQNGCVTVYLNREPLTAKAMFAP